MNGATALPLVIVGPLALAALLAAVGSSLPRPLLDALAVLSHLAVTCVGLVLLHEAQAQRVVAHLGGWRPHNGTTLGVVLVADRASAALVTLIGSLSVAVAVFSWRYLRDAGGIVHALVLGLTSGMVGFVLSGDLFTMFVFFELMGVAGVALAGHSTEEPSGVQGATMFGFMNALGAYAALLGIALLYARTGALNLAQMGEQLATRPPDALVAVAAALVTAGWLVKGALVPFHFWLADTHAAAPAPVCVLFSGVMVPLGLYGAVRVQTAAVGASLPAPALHDLLLYGGGLTTVVGAGMCVQQLHLKRMLALSTVSHVGLFAAGASTLTPEGVGGAGLYVLGHAGVKGALFLSAGVLLDRYGSISERELHGRGTAHRIVGGIWLLCGLALAGLPPFGTWLGKSVVEEAAGAEGAHWLLPLAVLTSALTGAAVLRAGVRVFLGRGVQAPGGDRNEEEGAKEDDDTEEQVPRRVPWSMTVPIAALALSSLAVGLCQPLHTGALTAGRELLDRGGYSGQVLTGARLPVAAPLPVPPVTATALGAGLLGVVLALLLAAGMLRGSTHRSVVAAVVRAPGQALRALHTGHLGDQAAWLVAGLATVGGLYLARV